MEKTAKDNFVGAHYWEAEHDGLVCGNCGVWQTKENKDLSCPAYAISAALHESVARPVIQQSGPPRPDWEVMQPEPERGTAPKIEFFGPSGDGCHINVDGKWYAYGNTSENCWKNALLRALAPSPLPVREQTEEMVAKLAEVLVFSNGCFTYDSVSKFKEAVVSAIAGEKED